MEELKSNSKYDLSAYSLKCPICRRISKNNKCLTDHIFHMNLKDQTHKEFAEYLRQKSKEDFFKKAYELYSLFWGINLKLVDIGEVKKIDDNQIDKKDEAGNQNRKNNTRSFDCVSISVDKI